VIIFDNSPVDDSLNGETPGQDMCKLIIIDSETEEEDVEFPIITLRTDSYNQLDPETVSELLCPKTQKYVLIAGSDDLLPGQKTLLKNNGLLREEPFFVKYSLTPQEGLVMDCLIRGLSSKEIAIKQYKSYSTVKNHITNIFIKLKVKNRASAILKYIVFRYGFN
jgi:LuxR family transcriptional regulator of spore coat protein